MSVKHKGYTNLKVVDEYDMQQYVGYEVLEVLPYQRTIQNPVQHYNSQSNYSYTNNEIVVVNEPRFLIGLPQEEALAKLHEQSKSLSDDHQRLFEELRLAKVERDQAIKLKEQSLYKQQEYEERIKQNAEEFHALRTKHLGLVADVEKIKVAIGVLQYDKITKA